MAGFSSLATTSQNKLSRAKHNGTGAVGNVDHW
jgi:hypothetical protein